MAGKRRVLIVGGTGTIGSHLLKLLDEDRQNLDIIVAARSAEAAKRVEKANYTPIKLDLDDHKTIVPALDGVDTIFTLKSYLIDFLIHSKRLIDAAEKVGVRNYIDVSSMAPKDLPYAPMGWNRLVDAYLRQSGIGHTILHPNLFMDNILRTIDRDRETQVIRHLIGDYRAGWIAAKDIARVAAAVIRDPSRYRGQTIPMATDRRSYPEVVALINEATGKSYRFEKLEPGPALEALIANGAHREQAAPLVDYYHNISQGKVGYFGDLADPIQGITGESATLWPDFIRENLSRF